MANTLSKIDRLSLGPRVMQMVLKEGLSSARIAEILTADGFRISQTSVSRYIRRHRKDVEPTVSEMVMEHVQATVPKDLEAVEGMEARALAWGEEDPETQAERMAAWEKILAAIDGWTDHIRDEALKCEDKKAAAVKAFAKQCLLWVIEDLDNKKTRMAAMKLASGLIELKLRYSGVIDGAGSGNIFIMGDDRDKPAGPKEPGGDKKDGVTLSLVEKKS